MKYIELTQGKQAIVDDVDFELVNKHKWYCMGLGYAMRFDYSERIKKAIYLHRIISNCPKGLNVDHINHNKLDNRRENLRIVTKSQNGMNQNKQKRQLTSDYKGVCWNKTLKYWVMQCKLQGKVFCTYHKTELEAAKAYDLKAKELFGEYSLTNL
ncbi:MAG TPA: HNH endonuclease [Patescibacteria group bacterium]